MEEEELDLVRALPINLIPVSRPSERITRLLEKRREAHEELLQIMDEKIEKINENADQNIKDRSDDMKKLLLDVKEDVNFYFIDVKFKLQSLDIEDDYYARIRKKLSNFSRRQSEAVDDFCNFLRESESSRQQQFKDLLRNIKSNALKIAHESPFMLDEFFGEKITEMNKITLSNYQHYAEVEKELQLQVKNDMKLWLEQLIEIRETLKEKLKSYSRKSTAFVDEGFLKITKSADLSLEISRFNSLKSEFNFELAGEDSFLVSTHEVERWLKEIQKFLGALDQSAKNIVALYKSTITVLFHRYLHELSEIKQNMHTGLVHTNEIDPQSCEMYTPSADQLQITYFDELKKLQDFWGESMHEMTDNINLTFSFLKGATCLWDRHFVRVKELQVTVLTDLENTIKKNTLSSDCYEAQLNIVLEELRQGSNVKELEKSLENAKKILTKMEKTYFYEANDEISVIMKYKTMMQTGIEVLTTELKRYLTFHPPDLEKDPKKQRRRASQISLKPGVPEQVLPIQILYCVFQVGAVKNWMFGLWEAIDQYVNVCTNEILILVDQWISVQTQKIQERLKMKLMFHEPRFQHVKCSNYEKRLKELKLHMQTFERHKLAAEEAKLELNIYQKEYEEECEKLCNDYVQVTNDMVVALPTTNNTSEMQSFSSAIKEKLAIIENQIKYKTDDYIESCTRFLEELKVYNYQFLTSARIFSEGGNFNMDELNELYNNLKKLEDASSKDVQNYIKEINTKFWRYTSRIQGAQTILQTNISDILKEHEHNEMLVKRMNKLQIDLKTHVKGLKKLFSDIDKKCQRLRTESRNNVGKKEFPEVFIPQFQNLLEDVVEVCQYVYHPEPVTIFTIRNDVLTTILASGKTPDYVNYFFNKLPDAEGSDFITKMVILILNCFNDIKASAYTLDERKYDKFGSKQVNIGTDKYFKKQKFYNANTRFLLDNTKLHPTFAECMDEVLRKFKPYLIQCEICWLENAIIFLSNMNGIKIFKEEFPAEFEDVSCTQHMENFDSAVTEAMDQLALEERNFNGQLQEIYKRLKVLFGHPKNNEMLKQLQADYDDLHADNQEKFEQILQPYHEHLDEVVEEIKVEVKEMRETLEILKEDHKIYELIEKLVLQITTKKTLLSAIVAEISEADQISISKDTIKYIQSYFQTAINESVLNNSTDASQVKAPSLATVITDTSCKSGQDFLDVLQNNLKNTKVRMKNFVALKMEESLENFKNIWDSDIEYILSLYKIKYDP